MQDVPGAGDVGLKKLVPGEAFPGLGGEMHDHVLTIEGRSDGVVVSEIGACGGNALNGLPVERRELRIRTEPCTHETAD